MGPFNSPTPTYHTTSYPSISPTRPELSAKDKTILITGGGTGIGAETALYFAIAGASRIALLGRREQPLSDTKARINKQFPEVEIFAISTDITKKTEVEAAFTKIVGEGRNGKIDVLISNAAQLGPQVPVRDVDGDDFLDGIHQNLKGTLNLAQEFLKYASTDAIVINISSLAAYMKSLPGLASYSIAKMSIIRFWDCLVYENPEIRVFHIQPGIVDTAMNRATQGIRNLGVEEDDGKCGN